MGKLDSLAIQCKWTAFFLLSKQRALEGIAENCTKRHHFPIFSKLYKETTIFLKYPANSHIKTVASFTIECEPNCHMEVL